MSAHRSLTLLLAAVALATAAPARATSDVFAGDPVDSATGRPYEILPGMPLVLPGPDGVLGTADDVVDATKIGDVDLVVRSGSPVVGATIPAPTAAGGRLALPLGVAGSTVGGGTQIPFTVLASDGITSAGAPAGHPITAPALDGLPVIVIAFADLDGDGFIGLTRQSGQSDASDALQVRELEPVGRGVALWSGGVAHGSVAIGAGLPASQGGLTVALTAVGLTGPFDPAFLGGVIPSGPAISTALPFLPQRDLTRLLRDRPVAFGPTTTLQDVVRLAALPVPGGPTTALPLDGSSPTIDAAVVTSQAAVRIGFRDGAAASGPRLDDALLGTSAPAATKVLRVVPLDRWGNPADPPPGFSVKLRTKKPVKVVRPAAAKNGKVFTLPDANGVKITLKVRGGDAVDGATGALLAVSQGIVSGALPYRISSAVNAPPADVLVPGDAPTIQAAIDTVTDGANHDGLLVVEVAPGIYRENVVLDRAVIVRGAGPAATIVQGDGSAGALRVTTAGASVQGLTVSGGTRGLQVDAPGVQVAAVAASDNVGEGVRVAAADLSIVGLRSSRNGGAGLLALGSAAGLTCDTATFTDNAQVGVDLAATPDALLVGSVFDRNSIAGVRAQGTATATIAASQAVLNFGPGVALLGAQGSQVTDDLLAVNDDDGLDLETTTNGTITGNALLANKGYGLRTRRGSNDDFAAAAGVQAPLGDNVAAGNRKGDLLVRSN